MDTLEIQATFADQLIAFANNLAEDHPDADLWEIADGILSGTVHWWLYANSPCDDPRCENCAEVRTAELRMRMLQDLIKQMAESSEYYHSPNDEDTFHA